VQVEGVTTTTDSRYQPSHLDDTQTQQTVNRSGDPAESFTHYRELEHERQAEEEIYAGGGWISGHCGDPRCAL
jgi:hypothetical protein